MLFDKVKKEVKKVKIVFFEINKWEEDFFKERLKGHKLEFFKGKLNLKNASKVKGVQGVVSFIKSDLSERVLSKLKKLKFISTMSTGFDHIDLKYCRKARIRVSNVPHYGEHTVAEHAFALILALARKLDKAINRTRKDDFSLKGLMGFDLKGKTLGVIGVGNIGQHVVKIGHGFEMKVLGYGRNRDKKLSKKLGFKWVSLNSLLKKSDIVTIHVPLNKGTKHLINLKNAKYFKKGSYLINTSRGEVVDNGALLYGLKRGLLAGAGLDVLEGECEIREERELMHGKVICDWETLIENHLLLKDKNVIVTPHSAFYTREALERILEVSVKNISGFENGRVRNKVV
mgnify:CR=1 FL=1